MASDDLRARIAEALATCQGGTTWARMAEAVMAVVQPELDREAELSQLLMDQRQQMAAERYTWQERGDRAEQERDIALARLESVRALHRPDGVRDGDGNEHCVVDREQMPCPTVQALDAPPRGLSAPYCGAYMSEWVCTLPPGRHSGWRHFDAEGNWWDQTRCPTDCGEPAYRHAANGCPEGPKTTEENLP